MLRKHIEAGQITAVVATTYPMVEVTGAMTHLEAGGARGKIAITI